MAGGSGGGGGGGSGADAPCATPGCPYLRHSKQRHGYCCNKCKKGGGHGGNCEKRPKTKADAGGGGVAGADTPRDSLTDAVFARGGRGGRGERGGRGGRGGRGRGGRSGGGGEESKGGKLRVVGFGSFESLCDRGILQRSPGSTADAANKTTGSTDNLAEIADPLAAAADADADANASGVDPSNGSGVLSVEPQMLRWSEFDRGDEKGKEGAEGNVGEVEEEDEASEGGEGEGEGEGEGGTMGLADFALPNYLDDGVYVTDDRVMEDDDEEEQEENERKQKEGKGDASITI